MLDFLTPKISAWAIGAMGAVLLAVLITEEIRISDVRADLKAKESELSSCREDLVTSRLNAAVLKASVDEQNEKIEAMRADAARAAAASDKAVADWMVKIKAQQTKAAGFGAGPDVMNAWQKELYQ